MRARHQMPFGAEVATDGEVRFRLWAPGLDALRLSLEDGAGVLAMEGPRQGWFQVVTRDVAPGSRYAFVLPDGRRVPDPASRCQADDVHGPSVVVDPLAYPWKQADWSGRPWEETVFYELHVGAFARAGTFDDVRRKLDHLSTLGVTAVELMPLADFAGRRNWGYDGVLPFAPDRAYGAPEGLKALIDEAHARDLMVFLDVVYNHFGPEGNYLHLYAPQFFTERYDTPWGAAIDFTVGPVRQFFLHNALYWIHEYRVDGLRLDAVHAIRDDSATHFLDELAATVRASLPADRQVHLVLENDANQASYLERDPRGDIERYAAQWNDDCHHCLHVLLTGQQDGYYADYAERPAEKLARSLSEGFVYQGEASAFRGGERRGEPSAHLPPTAFVCFLQNHDQVGNRAFGERLSALASPEALDAALSLLLLSPTIPMLFMGEEWGETSPFQFFCDFHDELAAAVRDGRRQEFARFSQFADAQARARIPDPNAPETFDASRLDWSACDSARHAERLALCRSLLALRQREIVPRLAGMPAGRARSSCLGERGVKVAWELADGAGLTLCTNLGDTPVAVSADDAGPLLFESRQGALASLANGSLPAWSTLAWLEPAP